jgi:DNA invertase Pin-like site-specific DNA recombinase
MMTFGYARISTHKQNIERQVRNILAYDKNAVIVRETFTGTKFQGRTELDKIIREVKKHGGKIIFDSVSRMSRDADEGFILYKDLFNTGINLVFLKEPHINTDTYKQAIANTMKFDVEIDDKETKRFMESIIGSVNDYILSLAEKQIRLAFEQSQKEVQDLHQRTREGLVTAKLNGKRIGQPSGAKLITKKSIAAKAKIKKYNKSFDGALNNEDTWNLIGISKMSFYKYKNELLAEVGAAAQTIT